MNVRPIEDAFAVAAREMVKRMPHGSQRDIARGMRIRDGYLSDLLAGRRNWSDQLRRKFADIVGFPMSSLYAIGENFLETGRFFPYVGQVVNTIPASVERASLIVQLVFRELKIEANLITEPAVIQAWRPKEIQAYTEGRINDGDLYAFFMERIKHALKNYTLKK